MTQIYGFAYHSPLFLQNLCPRMSYAPLYLEARWTDRDLVRNVTPVMQAIPQGHIPLVVAGSLTALKAFVRGFPKFKGKVMLCDFPGLINPFRDPLLEWIDCDHQNAGAWQTLKLKYEAFSDMLGTLDFLGDDGRDLILRMVRWQSRDRVSEIEQFNESLPTSYKALVDYESADLTDSDKGYDVAKDHSWKRKSLKEILAEVLEHVQRAERRHILDIILDYQLSRITKREYNSRMKGYMDASLIFKKKATLVRKWIDDAKHGRLLFQAYLDYLCNIKKRSWKTVLDDSAVNEQDLLIVISKQPCSDETSSLYSEEIKGILEFPPNMHPPEATVRWSTGLFSYHPEPPALAQLFDF